MHTIAGPDESPVSCAGILPRNGFRQSLARRPVVGCGKGQRGHRQVPSGQVRGSEQQIRGAWVTPIVAGARTWLQERGRDIMLLQD